MIRPLYLTFAIQAVKSLRCVAIASLATFATLSIGAPSKDQPIPVWESLFNGQDLTGWKVVDGIAPVLVDDGTIVAVHQDKDAFPYLIAEETYSDFILELEVKVVGDLNSGILIRGLSDPEFRDGRIHGYQMEIDQSPRQWTGGIYEEAGRKWLYSLEGREEARPAYRPSTWNHYRVEAIGSHFKIWLNGLPVLNMIDNKTAEGLLGFQIHKIPQTGGGGYVSIRNIQIIRQHPERYSREMSIPALRIEAP